MTIFRKTLFTLLIALFIMSCNDDDSSVNFDDSGDGFTPNSKVVVKTYSEGTIVDEKMIEMKDGEISPPNSSMGGVYRNESGELVINLTRNENKTAGLTLSMGVKLNSLVEGDYTFIKNTDNFLHLTYFNDEISNKNYEGSSIEFNLTEVDKTGSSGIGIYYISGGLDITLNRVNEPEEVIDVKVQFENIPITYADFVGG